MHSHERLPVVRGLDQAIVISSWLVMWPAASCVVCIWDLPSLDGLWIPQARRRPPDSAEPLYFAVKRC